VRIIAIVACEMCVSLFLAIMSVIDLFSLNFTSPFKYNAIYIMQYIGNDIISLSSVENTSSFSNAKYIAKILTEEEIYSAREADMPFIVPLFWTIKESAYKVLCKSGNTRAFSPLKFQIQSGKMKMISDSVSQVGHIYEIMTTAYGQHFYSISEITPKYCHTTTILSSFKGIKYSYEIINHRNKGILYDLTSEKCIDAVARQIGVQRNILQLARTKKNFPVLLKNGLPLNIDVSLSYDDGLAAYAFMIQ
jgi:phosphopantetheinyl transferase (holo-ACP synthase)